MYDTHAPPYVGHQGILPTLKGAEMYFYWPTMKMYNLTYVSSFIICQKLKYDIGKQSRLLHPFSSLDLLDDT